MSRKRIRKPASKKLAIIALLAVLALGCANIASAVQRDEAEETAPPAGYDSDSSFSAPARSDFIQDTAAAPAIPEPFMLEDVPTSTPFPVAEATLTPEPSSTPTPVLTDTPSATPTASPTATHMPTATDTPTATATPTPTVTSPPAATATPTPAVTSSSEINHVVIISVDGMGPNVLEAADTPIMDELRAKGAYSAQAQTVLNSITLISHASMLTGMIPEKHGIQWGLPYIGWPGMNGPSLCSVAREAGLTTAMVFGKEKLNHLVLPNSVDELFGENAHDQEIQEQALEFIEDGMPNILFIHFPDPDRVGHAYGWLSQNQLFAINYVDGLIGEIVAALKKGGYLPNTLMIITADHGGHDFGHGDDSPLDRTIPWLAVGQGVPSGLTLSSQINTYDTAATALYALGLPVPEYWDGRPVLEIFE